MKLAHILVLAGLTGIVMLLGDIYYRLLRKWCPPDDEVEYVPPDISEYRQARVRRHALERMFERRPFDQDIE
jgi:hypothetical protein